MKRRSIRGLALVFSLCLPGMTTLLAAVPAAAEQATFKQKILPANCVFETVNDGTGTIRYLTPSTCWQFVPQFFTFPPAAKPSDQGQANAFGQRAVNPSVFQPKNSSIPEVFSEQQSSPLAPLPEKGSANEAKQTDASSSQPARQSWPKRHQKLLVASAAAGSALIILLFVFVVIL